MIVNVKRSMIVGLLTLVCGNLSAGSPTSIEYAASHSESTVPPAPSPKTYTIGQYVQGGVIFWLDPSMQHGLVASIVDMNGGGLYSGLWAEFMRRLEQQGLP